MIMEFPDCAIRIMISHRFFVGLRGYRTQRESVWLMWNLSTANERMLFLLFVMYTCVREKQKIRHVFFFMLMHFIIRTTIITINTYDISIVFGIVQYIRQ